MKRYRMETIVGLFVMIGLACLGYMAVKLGNVSLFSSVAGLRVDSPVNIFGIEVGVVSDLSIDQDRQMALAKMKLRKDIHIYDDASAVIKTAGLIGDKYIEIDPGGAGHLLKSGGWILQTSSPPDISDIIGKYAFGNLGGNPEGKNGEK
jgi:phospholipid/cholesterol/gamma-HCH transport system substrate-binding protein